MSNRDRNDQVFFELLDPQFRESEPPTIHAGFYSGVVGFVILIQSAPHATLIQFGRTVIFGGFATTSHTVFGQI